MGGRDCCHVSSLIPDRQGSPVSGSSERSSERSKMSACIIRGLMSVRQRAQAGSQQVGVPRTKTQNNKQWESHKSHISNSPSWDPQTCIA